MDIMPIPDPLTDEALTEEIRVRLLDAVGAAYILCNGDLDNVRSMLVRQIPPVVHDFEVTLEVDLAEIARLGREHPFTDEERARFSTRIAAIIKAAADDQERRQQ